MGEELDYAEEESTTNIPDRSEFYDRNPPNPYLYVNPLEQYDLQDPDPRKRRTGRMPPQLAKYWRQYDMSRRPRHRGRRKRGRRARATRRLFPKFADPRRRRRSRSITAPRRRRRARVPTFHMPAIRYRRRRHDPAIFGGSQGSFEFWRTILQAPVTTIGGIIHNWAVRKWPQIAGGFKVGNGAVGYAGLAAAGIGAGLNLNTRSMFGYLANDLGSGALSEAVNVPSAEGIATIPTVNAYSKGGRGGLAPYVTQSMPTMGAGVF